MVVDYLDIGGAVIRPDKTKTPLGIDTDAVLTPAIFFQRFELVSWRHLQVIKDCRPVKLREFTECRSFDVHPASYPATFEKGLGVWALETLDCHVEILTSHVHSVN